MAKEVLFTERGKEIIEVGDRKKEQAATEKIASTGVVRYSDDTCGS